MRLTLHSAGRTLVTSMTLGADSVQKIISASRLLSCRQILTRSAGNLPIRRDTGLILIVPGERIGEALNRLKSNHPLTPHRSGA